MNIFRKLRLRSEAKKLLVRFESKGVVDQSKQCAKLSARNTCKQEANDGKEEQQVPKKKVTLFEGEGVGSELVGSLKQVFEAASVPIEWEIFEEYKCPDTNKLNPLLVESLMRNKVGIKGPIENDQLKQLRKAFGLYAYVAVCRNLKGQKSPYGQLDCIVIRDVMEGEYSGIEHEVVPGILQSIKVVTKPGAERISRFVFKYALENNRKRITVAHKANIMQLTDGNFLRSMRQEASKHTDKISFDERYMDTACLNLVMKPALMDVLCSSSMYGDVLVMMASSIMGGKELCPGFSVSQHGLLYDTLIKSNFDTAGKDIINPTGILLSSVLLLKHLKLDSYADKISCAVEHVYSDTEVRTADTGGTAKCSEFTAAVCDAIADLEK